MRPGPADPEADSGQDPIAGIEGAGPAKPPIRGAGAVQICGTGESAECRRDGESIGQGVAVLRVQSRR